MKTLLACCLALLSFSACAPHDMAAQASEAASPSSSECASLVSPQSGKLEPLEAATPKGFARFQVEIADNDAEREFGLMCRTSLAPDRGMLFEFTPPERVSFWMHNTLIPLDIVFIGADGKVLNIAANAKPLDDTGLPAFGPAKGVLEIPGGRAAQIGLVPGAVITHPFFTR